MEKLFSWSFFAACCFCISVFARKAETIKQIDLPLDLNSEDYPDSPDRDQSRTYIPRYSSNHLLDPSQVALELQKRLVEHPTKAKSFFGWPESRRIRRPFLRKSYGGGNFRMSYPPGQKRPYYYAEPEGSEFLGGPGK